jgi:hypothetical protein
MRIGSLLAVLCLLIAPSIGRADNVVYSTVERDLAPAGSLFFDRNGNLYPDATVDIAVDAMQVEAANPYETLSLEGYYRARHASGDAAWTDLLRNAGVTAPGADFDANWTAVQDGLRTSAVSRIDAQTGQGKKPLFILVQGFNNTFLEAHDWYRVVRRDVVQRVPDATFVEVFWDGGTNPIAFPVWWVGQNNFRLVGLEFRRVLNALHPDTQVRIITHSSGGPMVANALGDASTPFLPDRDEVVEREERYFERATATTGPYAPVKRRDLRVAMIVPAGTPNTFSAFSASSIPDRLVIGQNPKDFAVTKNGIGCERFGNTCLATQPKAFCDLRSDFQAKDAGASVLGFDMSRSPKPTNGAKLGLWEQHAMTAYVRREDWTKVLDALLADAPGADESSTLCG